LAIQNGTHTLHINGQLIDSFSVSENKANLSGMAGLGMSKDSRPPLVVKPQEFYNFRVTDIESGNLLWGDNQELQYWNWTMIRGDFEITPRNRLRSSFHVAGAIGDPDWTNYVIDVDCANPTEALILFNVIDKNNYGRAQLRFWRELVVTFSYFTDGKQTFHRLKSLSEPFSQGLKSLVLRFVKVYAVSLLILLTFLLLFLTLSFICKAFSSGRKQVAP